ncbi:MAG: HNH endonuclease, partial [Proteobacteria bacterium]
LSTLVQMDKHLLVKQTPGSRHIPASVKTAVWQRDGGKCVDCGSNYPIEYDHDIPLSKGGSNTVGNIRILCRRCNLAKGNRV